MTNWSAEPFTDGYGDKLEKEVTKLSKDYGSIALLTACIMRNNGLSYKEASEIAEDMNGSDYVFDNFLDGYIERFFGKD